MHLIGNGVPKGNWPRLLASVVPSLRNSFGSGVKPAAWNPGPMAVGSSHSWEPKIWSWCVNWCGSSLTLPCKNFAMW